MKNDLSHAGTTDHHSFRTALVDTSLLVELQKRTKKSLPVRKQLRRYGFRGISSYSKLEFKRAWLQRLAYIHSICRKPDIQDVVDVLETINSLSHAGHRRRLHTCFDALLVFLDTPDGRRKGHSGVDRLKAHCKHAIFAALISLSEIATAEFKGTACIRAQEFPREQKNGAIHASISKCRPNDIQCTIHTFFVENKADFMAIADRIDKAEKPSDELKGIASRIRNATQNPTTLCDDRVCSKMGDALIAVDGKGMEEFVANNDREWATISAALGKPLINPVRGERTEPM